MDYRLWIGVSGILSGLIVVVVNFIQGDVVPATILLLVLGVMLAVLLWWTRPNRGGLHISHASARAATNDDDVIVYWRPGCVFCDRLKLGLRQMRDDLTWVNIARDPEAAEFVAGHHNGNEVVPTVVTGAGALLDPTPAAIEAQLAGARSAL